MYGFGDAGNTDLVSHYLSTLFQGVPLVGQPRGSTVTQVATSVKGDLQEDFQEEDDKAQSAEDDDNDEDVVVYQSDAEDFHKEEGEAWCHDRGLDPGPASILGRATPWVSRITADSSGDPPQSSPRLRGSPPRNLGRLLVK